MLSLAADDLCRHEELPFPMRRSVGNGKLDIRQLVPLESHHESKQTQNTAWTPLWRELGVLHGASIGIGPFHEHELLYVV